MGNELVHRQVAASVAEPVAAPAARRAVAPAAPASIRLTGALLAVETVAAVGLALGRPAAGAPPFADGAGLLEWLAWHGAAAVVAWHGLGTLVCALVRLLPRAAALRTLAGWSPAVVRRAAGVACAASVALGTPAGAAPDGGAPTGARHRLAVDADEPVVRAPAAPTSTTTVVEATVQPEPAAGREPRPAAPPAAAPIPLPTAAPAPPVERTHVVVRGDNLWRIARAEVALASDTERPSDTDVARYWRLVVEANRPTLRSGDPSLILPGEVLTLPPLPTG